MSRPNFRFKQFEVWHDKCAMKVGTDGVLLGAWCPIGGFRSLGVQEFGSTSEEAQSASEPLNPIKVLDIGTGSGLIALMLAQRLSAINFSIEAIDIDTGAVEQSLFNFAQSPWANHLACKQSALQDYQTVGKFDLIVSNPPYFQSSLKNPDQARATARHTDSLSYGELIRHAARLLADHGRIALILPAEAEQEIIELAKEQLLYPTHITYVHSKPGKVHKRILIAFSHTTQHSITQTQTTHFNIASVSSPRSEEYQELTKDFYL